MDNREVTYKLTRGDLVSGNLWALMAWGAQCRLFAFWFSLSLVLTIYVAAKDDRPFLRSSATLGTAVCMLLCYEAFLFIYVTIVARRSFSQLEVLQIPYTLKWSKTNFEWTSSRTRHAYTFQDIARWSEKRDKFLVQTKDNMLWIIGKKFFETTEDIEKLRNELPQKKR